MSTRPVPYTTRSGVKIGSNYSPPRRVEALSRDALRLQSALLEQRSPTHWVTRLLWRWL